MELDEKYITRNGNRINTSMDHHPPHSYIFKNTRELMELETIQLLYLLRVARKYRSEVYNLRVLRHKAEKQEGFTNDVRKIEEYSWKEYENATKKVRVIENIIKIRKGYYPEFVTDRYLKTNLERIDNSQKNKMFIRKKINNFKVKL